MFPCISVQHNSTANVRDVAERSLGFLRAIERTTHNLSRSEDAVRLLTGHARDLADELKGDAPDEMIDPEGALCGTFEKLEGLLHAMYDDAVKRRAAARADRKLSAEDGVEDGYTNFIASVADLHEAIHELRETVETLDALKSPRSEKFESLDDLFASLGR